MDEIASLLILSVIRTEQRRKGASEVFDRVGLLHHFARTVIGWHSSLLSVAAREEERHTKLGKTVCDGE
jgi:hypothetical protein